MQLRVTFARNVYYLCRLTRLVVLADYEPSPWTYRAAPRPQARGIKHGSHGEPLLRSENPVILTGKLIMFSSISTPRS
jgi:hypothetical protein